jgi:hypothetical protein
MPREKTLFFIGIWIILLSNFIGLPTEIKNYLFIATALLLVAISYLSDISKVNTEENFFHKKRGDKKVETSPESKPRKSIFKPRPISSLRKATEEKLIPEPEVSPAVNLANPFKEISESSYEPPIKVRRARIKPKPKLIREELPIESTFNLDSEEDDVIVISSDGDSAR